MAASEKPLPSTLRFGVLEILLGNAEKPHEVNKECDWYINPGFKGFGRGEGEKKLKRALN